MPVAENMLPSSVQCIKAPVAIEGSFKQSSLPLPPNNIPGTFGRVEKWGAGIRKEMKLRLCAEGVSGRGGDGSEQDDRHLFCFGMGYTLLGLANYMRKKGWMISGTCREQEKRDVLRLRGFNAFVFDPDNDESGLGREGLHALRLSSHVISSVPPVGDFDRDPVLQCHAEDLRSAAEAGCLRWLGYLSSTGVYGDFQGDWVDEETEPRPADRRSTARLEAERAWQSLGHEIQTPATVFRLGGIYGPSRSAMDTIAKGRERSPRQRERAGRRFTSRVHVADICRAVAASMAEPTEWSLYNVVDDDPAPRREVMAYARALLNDASTSASSRDSSAPSEYSAGASTSDAQVSTENAPRGSGLVARKAANEGLGKEEVSGSNEPRGGSQTYGGEGPGKDDSKVNGEGSAKDMKRNGEQLAKDSEKDDSQSVQGGKGSAMSGFGEKRVRNARLKTLLKGDLLFPTYREGLLVIANGGQIPFD